MMSVGLSHVVSTFRLWLVGAFDPLFQLIIKLFFQPCDTTSDNMSEFVSDNDVHTLEKGGYLSFTLIPESLPCSFPPLKGNHFSINTLE